MPLLTTIEPSRLPAVSELGRVHFIAIGGSGMSGVAAAMIGRGVQVSGSDRQDSKYLQALATLGARTFVGHAAEQVGDADTVVVSSAIREDNPELAYARAHGLRVLHRSAALASLMLDRRGVAVAGTHGKTTTTAMIAHVLTGAGLDPSYVIGGAMTGSAVGGHVGTGEPFVVEADESDGSFLQYPAEVAVVTNVDPDHLSNWGSAEAYADGFTRFATGETVRLLVVSADEPGAVALTERVRATTGAPSIVTFGEAAGADVRIGDIELAGTGSTFTLDGGPVALSVPGHYNVLNAAAAYAVARHFGVAGSAVRSELDGYGGTYRRFQLVGTAGGVRVYDDYAHHPTEVANTLSAARTGAGDERVVVCFQPHLYTRTRDFWPELAAALELADEAVVMDVCGDREDPIAGIDGWTVAGAVRPGTAHVTYVPDWDAAAPTVASIARPGDLVITVGCGDVTKVAPKIMAELQRRAEEGELMATITTDRPRIVKRPDPVPRRRRLLRLLVLILVLTLVGTGVWLVGFSSVLATRQVDVSGTSVLSAAEVRTAARVPIGTPLARQDLTAVADRIAALPPVESVEVARRWPDAVVVQVTERTPAIAVKQGSSYQVVDRHGIAYDTTADRPRDVAVAEVDPGNGPVLIAVAAVVGELPKNVRSDLSSVKAGTLNDITLSLDGGLTVVWGSRDQTALKAQVLAALRDQKGSYRTIDVSAPHSPAVR